MDFKKKTAALALSAAMLLGTAASALAASYKDVPENYWAIEEIDDVVTKKIIPLYSDGTFKPSETVPRVEWTEWLLRALGLSDAAINFEPDYSDVNYSTYGYPAIARSDQYGLIYGYTDGEFKPQRLITKTETASIMSHITKDTTVDTSSLNRFTDADKIPSWGVIPYAKAVKYGLYVNYPVESQLQPEKLLDRAEAAVLLSRLMKALALVEDKYKAPDAGTEQVISVEHLDIYPAAIVNRVNVTNLRKIVLGGNVLKAAFSEKFNSSKTKAGEPVNFYFKNDVKNTEGTLVIPAGSKLYGYVEAVSSTKAGIKVTKIVLPDGRDFAVEGRVLSSLADAIAAEWLKPLVYVLKGKNAAPVQTSSVGAAEAALAAQTPVSSFKAKAGDEIYIELKADGSIFNEDKKQEEADK